MADATPTTLKFMEKMSRPNTPIAPDYNPFSKEGSAKGSDIVLRSSNGFDFYTHSFLLKTASGLFRTTLSLPQAAGTMSNESIIGPVPEDAETIDAILRIISGLPFPALDTFELVEKVLITADKWDMPGTLSVIRRISIPPALSSDPLRLYIMACRFGWIEAAKLASTLTLDLDLRREEFRENLCTMESKHLLELQDLRIKRRDMFYLTVSNIEFLRNPEPQFCAFCRHITNLILDRTTILDLGLKCFKEMDTRPSGRSLLGSSSVISKDFLPKQACSDCRTSQREHQISMKEFTAAIEKELAVLPNSI
ncbi:hypothetical protein K439DRAFT_1411644 [Ramaria rubella]|nr:hypothetical protein K439DRAFT_1411644 [Ramaria rubella]